MERNNSSNSNNMMMDSDEEEVTVVPTAGKQGGKNWPHMKFLCTRHKDVLFKLLHAVDECKCTTELNANNTDYPAQRQQLESPV
jgi:hypothetical protein